MTHILAFSITLLPSIKKPIVLVSIILLELVGYSQTPQFAVVRPNGTTFICPSWDSAYNKASEGDFIYLPGTTITGYKQSEIHKQLTIIGAGHYPDSTQATGNSYFNGSLTLFKKCHLEGFSISSIHAIDAEASNSTFKRVRCFDGLFLNTTGNHIIDGCVITGIYGLHCTENSQNNLIKNTIIIHNLYYLIYTTFQNCILLNNCSTNCGGYYYTNSNFYNCIFKGSWRMSASTSNCFIGGINYFNCVFTQTSLPFYDANTSTSSGNFFDVNPDNIFVNQTGAEFNYQHIYHLKANRPYLTAGSDGTQIGIYGGSTPYVEGAVPSNPHIYFKQVAPQTNSNGQLQIQFKVRTGN